MGLTAFRMRESIFVFGERVGTKATTAVPDVSTAVANPTAGVVDAATAVGKGTAIVGDGRVTVATLARPVVVQAEIASRRLKSLHYREVALTLSTHRLTAMDAPFTGKMSLVCRHWPHRPTQRDLRPARLLFGPYGPEGDAMAESPGKRQLAQNSTAGYPGTAETSDPVVSEEGSSTNRPAYEAIATKVSSQIAEVESILRARPGQLRSEVPFVFERRKQLLIWQRVSGKWILWVDGSIEDEDSRSLAAMIRASAGFGRTIPGRALTDCSLDEKIAATKAIPSLLDAIDNAESLRVKELMKSSEVLDGALKRLREGK